MNEFPPILRCHALGDVDHGDEVDALPRGIKRRRRDLRSGEGQHGEEGGERLWTEGVHAPNMLSIGLLTHIIGRPERNGGLASLLFHMTHKGKVWFARREDIARYWIEKLLPPL